MKARVAVAIVFTFVMLLACPLLSQSHKNVLVLQMESPHYPASAISGKVILETLEREQGIQVFEEYMEESRLGTDQQTFEETLRKRYGQTPIDLVLTVGQPPFRFLLERGEALWPNIPKVFTSVDFRYVPAILPPNMTGVASRLPVGATLNLALHLQPEIRHVFYVSGVSPADRMRLHVAEEEFQSYLDRVDFTYLNDTALPMLLDRLGQLPQDSVVIFGGIQQDSSGQAYVPARICPPIVAASNAPVYGFHETLMGCGIVGGALFPIEGNAQQAASLATRILKGEAAESIPVAEGPLSKVTVDWRQLKRWNIAQSRLPKETIILYREPGLWERYKTYFLTGFLALFVQVLLIVALIILLVRRRQSNQALQQLTGRVINAAEDERRHIARELHDDIGQRLSLVSVQLSSFIHQLRSGAHPSPADLTEPHCELDAIITDVHDLSHRLHSSKLQHLGLKAALRELCDRFTRQHAVQITFRASDTSVMLSADISLCFYRIAQEALSNIVRHSKSPSADVVVEDDVSGVRMQIKDLGVGFDPEKASEGLGLVTMRERLRTVDGRLSVITRPGEGTVVVVEVDRRAAGKAA